VQLAQKRKDKNLGPVSAHIVGNTTAVRLSRLVGPVLPQVISSHKYKKGWGLPAEKTQPALLNANENDSQHAETAYKPLRLLRSAQLTHRQPGLVGIKKGGGG